MRRKARVVMSDGQLDIFGVEHRTKPKRRVTPARIAAMERASILQWLGRNRMVTMYQIALGVELDQEVVRLRMKELQRNGEVRVGGKQMRLGGSSDRLWTKVGR